MSEWTKGDLVTMRYGGGKTTPATVMLASPCSGSLMLSFEAILEGHVGMMPLLREEDGTTYKSIITGLRVTLEPQDAG